MHPSKEDLIQFTGQLSTLIDSGGHSLVESLSLTAQQQQSKHLQQVLTEVKEGVQSGKSLSMAMAQHPQVFDRSYVEAVREGENTTTLEAVLRRLGSPKGS